MYIYIYMSVCVFDCATALGFSAVDDKKRVSVFLASKRNVAFIGLRFVFATNALKMAPIESATTAVFDMNGDPITATVVQDQGLAVV